MKKKNSPLRVAFIHHHLRPGGVSKVIAQQIQSLGDMVSPLLVVGEPPSGVTPFPHVVVRGLAYDRDRKDREPPEVIAANLEGTVYSHFEGRADILHFHNPTLGKNSDLLRVIQVLVEKRYRMLLQIHDFAEDGRPMNYSPEPYPADSHYAVINTRDYELLLKAGLRPEGLHRIPNSVVPLRCSEEEQKVRDIVLYPVRAIRRKNIGEAVFLSLFLTGGMRVGVTLEPTGRLDCRSYDDWRCYVRENSLPVSFRLGIEHRFEDILARAGCMITTSIKEGFGYCFLEPWTCGRMLFGRGISDICLDFEKSGIQLGHLYRRIDIPLRFFDLERFITKWKRCYEERLTRYGLPVDKYVMEDCIGSMLKGGTVDFSLLSEDLQREVVSNVLEQKSEFDKMLDVNPFLMQFSSFKGGRELIESNRKKVEQQYSLIKCRETLLTAYNQVMERDVSHVINKKIVLEEFNAPQKNHLLLCEAAYG